MPPDDTLPPATPAPEGPVADRVLDASGLTCPLPVLRAQKLLRGMQSGQVLCMASTDAMSEREIPLFCEQAGHTLLHTVQQMGAWYFWIQRGV